MTAQLLVEIVVEELPASFVRPALAAFRDGVVGLLDRIDHGAVRTYATPRRLAVVVDEVAAGRPLSKRMALGPPESRAFVDGEPTKAGLGFARGKGVHVSELQIVEGPKGPVVAVEIEEGGESTRDLVGEGLGAVITSIPFRKSMEWGEGGFRFARPLHRVNAVYDGLIIPGSLHSIPFGNSTPGHRLTHKEVEFLGESDWLDGLRELAVEPDLAMRESTIRDLLVGAQHRLDCDPIEDARLLEEVLHLVEAPTLVIGEFDAELLDLPPRLLIKAMKAHQRYFPIFRGGALSNQFAVISNNPWGDEKRIATGNANVLRARFHDAKFFFAEDRKQTLDQHGTQLEKMRWIRGLGTVAQKGVRVAALGRQLAPRFGANPEHVHRAGLLCKSDLATLMVGEFGDLQGHMGRLYAEAQGEPIEVAVAIEQHYQPAGAADAVASSPEGAALAVADRLDTLVGCFGIGMVPKGSGDPQGLRRAMLGIQRSLTVHGVQFELAELFALGVANFQRSSEGFEAWEKAQGDGAEPESLIGALVEFSSGRFKAHAISQGASPDLVEAVLSVGSTDGIDRSARLDGLLAIAKSDGFLPIMHTFKRVLNITRKLGRTVTVDVPVYTESAEIALAEAAASVELQVARSIEALDYAGAFTVALSLAAPVSEFFDAVLVDSPDPVAKAARVGLLSRVSSIFLQLADFSRISTR